MATDNNTIITSVYLAATNDYQQRIPDPTQSSIDATMKALFDPMNKKYLNQFIDILVNRIAFTYVRSKMWDNPLAVFKGAKVNYGSTIQEIAPKWIKAHSYDDEAETLLKLHRPEAEAWYHSQNRRDQYAITVNYDELRTAFVDEYGLNNLISSIMAVPMSSDNYDEYRIMVELIGLYENNWGFYKYHLDALPDDEASAKTFLKALRTLGGKLRFPSTIYNAAAITDIPVFATNSELVILTTPEAQASIDVDALAVLFNMEKADVQQRIVLIDEFPIPNAVALLTTEDFFVCNDTLYENTSFYNPQRLDTTYYLNHWGIYSVSPFVPAILFTTDAETVVESVKQEVTGLDVSVSADTVDAGGKVDVIVKLQGTLDPAYHDGVHVAPDAATYELSAEIPGEGDNPATAVKLNYVTRVDEYGVLHTAKTLPSGTVITIKATSTYFNPSGETTADLTGTATVTIN